MPGDQKEPKQNPSWHSSKWHKNHPEEALPASSFVVTVQDRSKSKDASFWNSVVDVVEQPLILTGLAILAALVDIISHAPVLLFVGVLVLLGFHRAGKVSGKDICKVQVPCYVILFVVVSGLLYGVHVLLQRHTAEFVDDIAAKVANSIAKDKAYDGTKALPDTFQISMRKVHQHMTQTLDGQTGEFWLVEKDAHENETLYPIPMMVWLDFTNVGTSSETVKNYQASVQTQECGWITLYPLYMGSNPQVYYAGMTFKSAVAMDFGKLNLQTILGKDIPASGTVGGWLFLYAKVSCPMREGEKAKFRLVVDTYSKKHQEFISEEQTIIDERSAQPSPVGVTKPIEYRTINSGKRDISGIPRRNFVSPEIVVSPDTSHVQATETVVPERWKIPGNRFSEMPSPELCDQSRGLAARTRKDQEDTDNAVVKSNDDHREALQQPNLAESRRQFLEEDSETQRNVIRAGLDQRYLFSYKPDGILLLRALEKRVPAGTMVYGETESYARLGEQRPGQMEPIARSLVHAADALCPSKQP